MTVTVTATPEPANWPPRIRLDITSTGETSTTVMRQDANGQAVPVRTYDGNPLPLGVQGSTVQRTNLASNPAATSTTGWTFSAGTGGAVSISALTGQTAPVAGGPTTCLRATWTTSATGANPYLYYGAPSSTLVTVAGGATYTSSLYVRCSKAQTFAGSIQFYDASNALISSGTTVGAAVALTSGSWAQVSVTATAPANATHAIVLATFVGATVAMAAGDTLDTTGLLIEQSASLGSYFDGGTTSTSTAIYAWTGAANASTSTQSNNPATNVGLVYDYEVPLGTIVTFSSLESPTVFSPQVAVTASQPWLIHPGVPSLSQPLDLRPGSLQKETRTVQRGVFYPMGRRTPVVITDGSRKAGTSQLVAYTATLDALDAMGALLSDAATLLLNLPAGGGYGFPTSYIAVGDVDFSRWTDGVIDGNRDVTLPFQVVDRPVGGSQSERTFADLLAYPTFAALQAAYPSFTALLAGP